MAKKTKVNPPQAGKKKKTKDKTETAEYVRNLAELHKIQGAVLRLLQKSVDPKPRRG